MVSADMDLRMLLLLCFFSYSSADASSISQYIYRYIFAHEDICGDPFVNPEWLPAINDCVIGCELKKFICLMHTENRQQKCQSLPKLCISALAREFDWSDEEKDSDAVEQFQIDMLQQNLDEVKNIRPVVSTVTNPTTNSYNNLENNHLSNYGEDEEISFPQPIKIYTILTTTTPVTTSTTTKTTTTSEATTTATTESPATFGAYEYPIQAPYMEEERQETTTQTPFKVNYMQFTTFPPPVRIDTTQRFSLKYSPYITLKVKHLTTTTDATTTTEYFTPSPGSRVDLIPPPPPPDPVNIDNADVAQISHMINHFNSITTHKNPKREDSSDLIDKSRRCCEWALNGLCDSNWQKVRVMCPKSCGTFSCEDVEGVKSCKRTLDVDVEECYQSLRIARRKYHAAPIFVVSSTSRKSTVSFKTSPVVIKSSTKRHKKRRRSKKAKKF